jgi:hypothetical protein
MSAASESLEDIRLAAGRFRGWLASASGDFNDNYSHLIVNDNENHSHL